MSNHKNKIIVIGLIEDSEGKILLQKRNDPSVPEGDGKWEFPGGTVEIGENPEDTLKRECEEEIGCEVLIEKLLPQKQFRSWQTSNGLVSVEVGCYICKIKEGKIPKISNEEVSEIKWFSEAEILDIETLPGIVDFIKQRKNI